MSWLLKQAEDILNRVDQQTNAAIHQHGTKPSLQKNKEESISDPSSSSSNKSTLNSNSTTRTNTGNRRNKKSDDSVLIDYLNNSTPVNNKSTRPVPFNNFLSDTTRTLSTPDMSANDLFKTTEQSASKSASVTPRSTTPPAQYYNEDEGLVLVKFSIQICLLFLHSFFLNIEYSINPRIPY
jgi:DNA mismatch repair ATPase MutL